MRTIVRILRLPALVYIFDSVLSYGFGIYEIFPHWDIVMHFIGGSSIAFSGFLFLDELRRRRFLGFLSPFVHVLFLVALVTLTASLWEFYEFLHDVIFGTKTQLGNYDTVGDLFMGLLGGLISSILLVWRSKERRKRTVS